MSMFSISSKMRRGFRPRVLRSLFSIFSFGHGRLACPAVMACLALGLTAGCSKKKDLPRVVEAPPAFALVRWCAVVDEETGRKLAALPNEQITTEGYTGRSCSNGELMGLLAAAAGEKRLVHVGGIRQSEVSGLSGLRLAGDTWKSEGTIVVHLTREGQPRRERKVLVQCRGEGDLQAYGLTEGAMLTVNCRATAEISEGPAGNGTAGTKTLAGDIRFGGELSHESSLVCLGRIGAAGGRNYDYVVVWQVSRSPESLLEQVRTLREQSGQAAGGRESRG